MRFSMTMVSLCVAGLTLTGSMSGARVDAQDNRPESEYLQAARQIARHLQSLHRREPVGLSWPVSDRRRR